MGAGEQEAKICGFDKEPCIKDRCALWAQVFVVDPQFGVPKPVNMCVFSALLLVAGSPKPVSQTVPLQGLKIGNS